MAEIRSKGAIGHVREGEEEGQGPSSGKFSRTHVVRVAPGAPPPLPFLPAHFFLHGLLFMYLLPFFRALGFFSYPLAGHLPSTEGAAKMQARIRGVGLRPEEEEEGCAYSEAADER